MKRKERRKKNEKKSFLKGIFGKKEEAEWTFLVKLGLDVDDAKAGSEKEHMWFDVISIDNGYVEAELVNQPYWIANLNEGDINRYPLELLTDWVIYAPEATYTPDTIYELI